MKQTRRGALLVVSLLGLLAGCVGMEKRPHPPSPFFEGKRFSLMLLRPPAGVAFQEDALNRLLWQWNESSPWFRSQIVGIATDVAPAGSVSSLIASLDEALRVRSDLIVVLHPRRFRWNGGGYRQAASSNHLGGPVLDEAEFLVSITDVKENREIGAFPIRVARRSEQDTPILEKLAYEIAVKAGFGWKNKE